MTFDALEWPHCAHGTATVTADTLNVRTDRGTAYPIVGQLARDTIVTVWAAVGAWYLVQAGDVTGWCSAAWLRVVGELTP